MIESFKALSLLGDWISKSTVDTIAGRKPAGPDLEILKSVDPAQARAIFIVLMTTLLAGVYSNAKHDKQFVRAIIMAFYLGYFFRQALKTYEVLYDTEIDMSLGELLEGFIEYAITNPEEIEKVLPLILAVSENPEEAGKLLEEALEETEDEEVEENVKEDKGISDENDKLEHLYKLATSIHAGPDELVEAFDSVLEEEIDLESFHKLIARFRDEGLKDEHLLGLANILFYIDRKDSSVRFVIENIRKNKGKKDLKG